MPPPTSYTAAERSVRIVSGDAHTLYFMSKDKTASGIGNEAMVNPAFAVLVALGDDDIYLISLSFDDVHVGRLT